MSAPGSAWEHIPETQAEARPTAFEVVRNALVASGDSWPNANASVAVDALIRSGHLAEDFGAEA